MQGELDNESVLCLASADSKRPDCYCIQYKRADEGWLTLKPILIVSPDL